MIEYHSEVLREVHVEVLPELLAHQSYYLRSFLTKQNRRHRPRQGQKDGFRLLQTPRQQLRKKRLYYCDREKSFCFRIRLRSLCQPVQAGPWRRRVRRQTPIEPDRRYDS